TLSLAHNQLSGSIPAELGNLSTLQKLYLNSNRLNGEIPPALGDLANLQILHLAANGLAGQMPAPLTNLTDLNDLDLGYNKLQTADATLRAFLESVDPDWEQTQTVAPTDLTATPQVNGVTLRWTPILYQNHGGFYEIEFKQGADAYTYHG